MSAFPDFAEVILNYLYGAGTNDIAPASYDLALSTADPGPTGSGFTEPVAGDYARLTITNDSTNFPAAQLVGGLSVKYNGVSFSFAEAASSWGTVTHWGLYGVISSTLMLTAFGAITNPRIISSGDTARVFVGDMAISLV